MKNKEGKIFTPTEIVKFMISEVGYFVGSNVIDNSCGDGQILSELVRININSVPRNRLKFELENHIHGVEVDPIVHAECISNLNKILKENNIKEEINWDIKCGDSLTMTENNGQFDFVIGNPPYIRTKDLTGDTSNYTFMSSGMVDLYLAFFELGFKQMKENGKMIYIAPSSWYTSESGNDMRNYIKLYRHLYKIWDFGHSQVFENAQTYVSITMFDSSYQFAFDSINFNEVCFDDGRVVNVGSFKVSYEDALIDNKFYFGTKEELDTLRNVLSSTNISKHIVAKNGYATLCDKLFIGNFDNEKYIIPIVKGSNYSEKNCIYPYNKEGKVISEEEFRTTCPKAYEHLLSNLETLQKRKTEEPWYAFGRTQGLKDTYKKKYAIKQILKGTSDMDIKTIESGVGVYGGLYIMVEDGYEQYLKQVYNKDFFSFIKLLRKYKSGGYYTFSTKDFNAYASYILEKSPR